ncbi:hypothetical protein [Labedaea rhizosphaerae]|uniref:DUF5642 domain-containing protein n=1 Tax=Labedaea rhizosphaerae TaxID=598644 RepID=A0A4R6S6B7_LABRH|nr:hypothetical protein [Labedaea rhizosphaerae]TDP94893.1 hypothetical protein EV186_105125 [Labedaea rhizosphaerae]
MHSRLLIVSAAVLVVAACSSDDPAISMDGARSATPPNASTCPLHLDPPAALKAAGVGTAVTPDSISVQKSKTGKPADDPIAAQRGGMSAIDAIAGVYVACDYKAASGSFDVTVVITPVKGAASVLGPVLVRDAGLSLTEARPLLESPPGAGEVRIVGETVAFGGIAVDGGDGAILVHSELPDVHDETLANVTKTLTGQLRN